MDDGIDLGIDFGTTNSWVSFVPAGGGVIKTYGHSSLCLWRNGETFFGEEAQQ